MHSGSMNSCLLEIMWGGFVRVNMKSDYVSGWRAGPQDGREICRGDGFLLTIHPRRFTDLTWPYSGIQWMHEYIHRAIWGGQAPEFNFTHLQQVWFTLRSALSLKQHKNVLLIDSGLLLCIWWRSLWNLPAFLNRPGRKYYSVIKKKHTSWS